MQEKHLYEYAVIRVVPRVEREEFLNVGIVLYSRPQKFLQTKYCLHPERLSHLYPLLDTGELIENLFAFERIANGGADAGPIGLLDTASRFRWLTASRSTILQTSKVHPGFCSTPAQTLDRLYNQLVL